jgi:hypothetical protein
MSYIISKTNPFVNTKLTEKGREKLAKGQLNFRYFGIGDSEINYGFEEIRDLNPNDNTLNGKSLILKPKDAQSNIKYFVSKDGSQSPLLNLNDGDVKTIKAIVNNKAIERGFFDNITKNTLVTSPYVVSTGVVQSDNFNGNNTILINSDLAVGNYILFKITNTTLGELTLNENIEPTPHLWYKIESKNINTYTLDRALPLLENTATNIQYIEYASGEIFENGMANSNVTPYWDVNTLSFDNSSNIPTEDVPFWNMNNIWSQNIIGLNTDTAEEFFKYGSNDLIGLRSPLLCYIDTISPSDIQLEDVCVDANAMVSGNTIDPDNRAISVIHYTNNEISNMYGEFLYIDDTGKKLEIEIPDMMYHRRKFVGGTATGDVMGMTFVSDGSTKHKIKNSEIEYFDLIEEPSMVNGEPKVVGKVLPNHHVVIFDNEEIVAALSYKSGRNWTLPELNLTLNNPTGGAGTGLLSQDESIYVTYVLEDSTGTLPYNLPCQKYAKITNTNAGTKDVSFTINAIDELPYMRKKEAGDNDGRGFYADKFKVLYQKVSDGNGPVSNGWKEVDFTSNYLTLNSNETIDPSRLENQLPESNTQKLTQGIDTSATTYVINDKLSLANNNESERLQFGDERFFYGNIRTHIGATVFKTVFDIKISANEFTHTTNPTRTIDETLDAPEVRVSEIGIYDSDKSLVFIGKLSEPIKLINGNTVTVELSMDF